MLSIQKVTGDSMLPKIAAGDFVIASRLFFILRTGDTVVVDHPVYQRIIKRIEKVCPLRGYWLSGENEQSISPENIGWTTRQQIIAKAIKVIRHPQ